MGDKAIGGAASTNVPNQSLGCCNLEGLLGHVWRGLIWDAGSWSVLGARFFGQEDVLVGRGVLPEAVEGRLQQKRDDGRGRSLTLTLYPVTGRLEGASAA